MILKKNSRPIKKTSIVLCTIMTLTLWLGLSQNIACHKKPEIITVDSNITRIIQARDFDSLLELYFDQLGKNRELQIRLDTCLKKLEK